MVSLGRLDMLTGPPQLGRRPAGLVDHRVGGEVIDVAAQVGEVLARRREVDAQRTQPVARPSQTPGVEARCHGRAL